MTIHSVPKLGLNGEIPIAVLDSLETDCGLVVCGFVC